MAQKGAQKRQALGVAKRFKMGSKWPEEAPFTIPKGLGSFQGRNIFDHLWAQNWPFWGCHVRWAALAVLPSPHPAPLSAARYRVLGVRAVLRGGNQSIEKQQLGGGKRGG